MQIMASTNTVQITISNKKFYTNICVHVCDKDKRKRKKEEEKERERKEGRNGGKDIVT